MADVYDAETRSRAMSRVRGADTGPERALRRALHRRGLRFRLQGTARGGKLPGRPDLVFASRRAAVFVHGCFWHRHPGCRYATTPATRQDYWLPKFARTIERDAETEARLREAGWRVAVVWECALRNHRDPGASLGLERSADLLAEWLATDLPRLELPAPEAP